MSTIKDYDYYIQDQLNRRTVRDRSVYEKWAITELAKKTIDEISIHYSQTGQFEETKTDICHTSEGKCCSLEWEEDMKRQVCWRRFSQYKSRDLNWRSLKNQHCDYCDKDVSNGELAADVFIYIGCKRAIAHTFDDSDDHMPESDYPNPNFHSLVRKGLKCCQSCGFTMEMKVKATYLARRAAGQGIVVLTPELKESLPKAQTLSQDQLTQFKSVYSIQLADPVRYAMENNPNFILYTGNTSTTETKDNSNYTRLLTDLEKRGIAVNNTFDMEKYKAIINNTKDKANKRRRKNLRFTHKKKKKIVV